jgi:phenylacetate-CoA ligase
MSEGIGFYEPDLETLGRAELRALQEEKLRRLMQRIGANRFYREKLRAGGLEPGDVRSLTDLRRVPFTTKAELVESQRQSPPYGTLPSYPLAHYRYFHQTSGTSGEPLRWLDTEEDWQGWKRCWGHVYRGAGVTEEDIVFAAFSFGPYIAHWSAMAGARALGALALSGGGLNSRQRLDTLIANRSTVLVSTPTYALHLAEVAEQSAIDLRASAIRVTVHAGESGASVPNVKRRIEEAWGAKAFDHAGATEVGAWAFDCQARTGAIHLNEAEFLCEVIDPASGEPAGEGVRGELVMTNLGRFGMPVLRYRTGDVVEKRDDPCPCGRTFSRIEGGVLGRVDDMFIVRGVNLYPSAVDNLICGIARILEYEVEIRRISGLDDLLIKVETETEGSFGEVRQSLEAAFRSQLNLRVGVQSAPRGSLPRYELKARRYRRVPE